jgi:hypothetical protein
MEKSGEGIETKGVARAALRKRVHKTVKTKGIDGKHVGRSEGLNAPTSKKRDTHHTSHYMQEFQNKGLAKWAIRNWLKIKGFRMCGKTRAICK